MTMVVRAFFYLIVLSLNNSCINFFFRMKKLKKKKIRRFCVELNKAFSTGAEFFILLSWWHRLFSICMVVQLSSHRDTRKVFLNSYFIFICYFDTISLNITIITKKCLCSFPSFSNPINVYLNLINLHSFLYRILFNL